MAPSAFDLPQAVTLHLMLSVLHVLCSGSRLPFPPEIPFGLVNRVSGKREQR